LCIQYSVESLCRLERLDDSLVLLNIYSSHLECIDTLPSAVIDSESRSVFFVNAFSVLALASKSQEIVIYFT
jgi:hypothetical protein